MYLVSVYWIGHPGASDRRSLATVLTAALLFRLTAWPLFPAFSDDVFRYHWEGRLQMEGRGNPYLVAPADPAWVQMRDETYGHVVLPEFKTIYGPVVELLQKWTYGALRGLPPYSRVFWFKLPAALFDLAAIAGLLLWLRVRGDPLSRVLIYAWCPLPVFEFWINGHNDSLLICFIAFTLWMDARRRFGWSAMSLGLAIAVKLWPAILWPWIALRRGWKPALLTAPVFLLLCLPYIANVWQNLQYASGFLGGWRNNDSLYGGILWAAGGDIYRAKYATFALLGTIVMVVSTRRWELDRAALVTIAAMLAISANVHPWYLTWLLPLLVTNPSAPLLLWISLVPLHYVVLIDYFASGHWNGVNESRWLVYLPVAAVSLLTALIRGRKADRAIYSGR